MSLDAESSFGCECGRLFLGDVSEERADMAVLREEGGIDDRLE